MADELKEVFISYHEKSAGKLASTIADALESEDISCWYAKRDLPPGEDFAKRIPQQINNCKVFLFLLNQGANTSEHMGNEMALAFRRKGNGITIIPYQVEACKIAPWLSDYYLTRIQILSSETMNISALAAEIAHKLGREPGKKGKCGANAKWTLKNGVLRIYKSQWADSGEMGDFYMQGVSMAVNAPPKAVNAPWWKEHDKIACVIIDSGITSVGQGAFYYCNRLNRIAFPQSLQSVKKYAFMYCGNLTDIVIPDTVRSIEALAFYGCIGLKSVSVPANAKIADNAFDPHTEVIRRPIDRFYSAENQAVLRQTIEEYESGRATLIPKTMEELKAME